MLVFYMKSEFFV